MHKTVLVDDLTGLEGPEGDVETVTYSLNGVHFEVDLSKENRDALYEAMSPIMRVSRQVDPAATPAKAPKGSKKAGKASRGATDYDPKEVRAWAIANGLDVPKRGRIPGDIVAAYQSSVIK